MKITFLGTAAAEGFPAVFCNCEYCRTAKKLKGKNIRTRSQALINDDLLIDLPADTYSHFLNNDIDGDKIRYLLVTHSHSDHFYEKELENRHGAYSHNMRSDSFDIYCNSGTAEIIKKIENFEKYNMNYQELKPFETVCFGGYTVTALPARHYKGDGALFYVIKGEKTILYAHDTGYFFEEVFDFLEKGGYVFDLVSLDCTNVDIPISDEGGHMGFANIERVLQRLEHIGAITAETKKIVNHFSHNGAPLHDKLQQRASEYGCEVAYDGMAVEV